MESLRPEWDRLVGHLREEYNRHNQDPNMNLEADFALRRIRLRCGNSGPGEWLSQTFTEQDLRVADLGQIAQALFDAAARPAH